MPSNQKDSCTQDGQAEACGSAKRIRLAPEVRRQQILEAALIEFSTLGFVGASISKIAQRAGTSKANLYVHFANKEEIFESLLKRVLVPARSIWKPIEPGQNITELIDSYVDELFAGLTPESMDIIRLLVSEGHRVPELAQRWYEHAIRPAQEIQQRRIDEYVSLGHLRKTPLTMNFSFVMAPILYSAIIKMVFGDAIADEERSRIKETLRSMLHMQLPGDSNASVDASV